MTYLSEIMDIMLPLIPLSAQADISSEYSLIERGLIDMAVVIGIDMQIKTEIVTDTITGEVVERKYIDDDLTLKLKWLGAYYAYRAYLTRLRDEFNRDAINFKTLTFEIKSLEKRPESVNDAIYQLNRFLADEVRNVTSNSSAIVAKATKFGGDS